MTDETAIVPENSAPKVYSAICAVMHDIGQTGISKDRKNVQQGYSFRGIDDVYNELNGLLSKHRLVMLPSVIARDQVERQTAKGGVIFYTTLTVDFKLVSAEDGTSETIRTIGEAMDSADKSSNKAQSAAYKYAAMMVFCIPTEGENDADKTTHEIAPVPSAAYLAIEKSMRGNTTPDDLRAWWKDDECKTWRAKLTMPELEKLRAEFAAFGSSLAAQQDASQTPFDDETARINEEVRKSPVSAG
jgi:hypothetical protein